MDLFDHFKKRIAEYQGERTPCHGYGMPRSPAYYARRLTFVDTPEAVQSLVDLARQLPLSYIALDAEFGFDHPGVEVRKDDVAYDPRSIRPLLLAVVLAGTGRGHRTRTNDRKAKRRGGTLYPFVVDLRKPELWPALANLLRLPICFVGHALHAEMLCLLQRNLPDPLLLWDSWVCEKVLHLGRHHKKYRLAPGADEATEARVSEETQEDDDFRCGLLATCQRYGILHRYAGDKDRLQQAFLIHAADSPFTDEQVAYAAEDALAAARLYPLQVQAALQNGVLHHLTTVEMPWVVTNARMVWHGIRVDAGKCREVLQACGRQLEVIRPQWEALGLSSVRSSKQLLGLFGRLGLLPLFRKAGKTSFTRDALDQFAHLHPTINLIRASRRVLQLQSDKLLTGDFVGADGRVHPRHRQLGADTGRQSCSAPNVLGLGRIFRPLIVPNEGRGIGEVDLCQIEVGLAGAVYHDRCLVEMFNTGDVYSAMVRFFYRAQLTADDLALPDPIFKKKFEALRNRMKRCTLGILYGLTPHGLALYLGVSKSEANELLQRFLAMFPSLAQALTETWHFGGWRGFVSTVSGLRRYRASRCHSVSRWERNWMVNHGVQGSAAVVFKAAGNRLDKLYREYDAWLIVALHDAIIFEAPLPVLKDVADLTERVLCDTVREYFPGLQVRAESSIEHPECWSKKPDSIEKWMLDPCYRIDQPEPKNPHPFS